MKKIALIVLSCFSIFLTAQNGGIKHLAFDKYTPGIVHLKDGQQQALLMNYSVVTGKMLYMEGGQYYRIDNPQDIEKVQIGGVIFVPQGKVFYREIVVGDDVLYMEHFGKILSNGKPDAYGGRSHVSSTVSLSTTELSDMIQKLEIPDEYKVVVVNKFFVKKDGKFYPFTYFSDIEAAYPEKGKGVIKTFIKDNKLKFRTADDYAAVFNFCTSK